MKRLLGSAMLALALSVPAQAQWVVVDPKSIAQELATYQKIKAEYDLAHQMATDIPGTFRGTNIPGQLQQIGNLIQQAQSSCPNMRTTVRVLPPACAVKINVAAAQTAQMNQTMVQLQSLQNLARGSTGTLQAEKANALAIIQFSTQLAAMQQAQNAAVVDQQIKDQQALNTRKPSPIDPTAP